MIALGIDASSSCSGLAVAIDGRVVYTSRWKPRGRANRKGQYVFKLREYRNWLREQVEGVIAQYGMPDKATVELGSNVRKGGRTTIRVLARWEAASFLVLADAGIDEDHIKELEASSARSKVLTWRLPQGQRKLDKARANAMIRDLFPDHHFADDNECDAGLMSLVPFYMM